MLTKIDSVKGMNTSSTGDGVCLGSELQSGLADESEITTDGQSHIRFSVAAASNEVDLAAPSVSVVGRVIIVSNVGGDSAALKSGGNVSGVTDAGGNGIEWPAGLSQMFVWTGSKWSCMSTTLS